jgi:hypothetical protein
MIRARVWFRCAAMHDPVMPVMVRPAVIGWKGKNRQIDLTIEREFKGAELLRRMKGWITVDPERAIALFEAHGRLKCFDNGELVVEVENDTSLAALERELAETFRDQCNIEPIPKGS